MMKIRNIFKNLLIIAIVFGFFFAPIFESASAMSYNYDFWKNIIPSAEGIAHQDTYYDKSFEYYKNDLHKEVTKKLEEKLNQYSLDDIKVLVLKDSYKDPTEEDFNNYNNAKLAIDSNVNLSSSVKEEIKTLIDEKTEYEKDENLYKEIKFNVLSDIQVYGDKIYVLSTPGTTNLSNIATKPGTTVAVPDVTELIVINSDMKWEKCINEFNITEGVRNAFDDYYKWNRLGFNSVSTGDEYTVAIDKSGNIWGWGSNEYGQLGIDPTIQNYVETPQQITWIGDEDARSYTDIFVAGNTTFALDSSKKLWVWGKNDYSLVSEDSSVEYDYQMQDALKGVSLKIKSVAVADDHVYAISDADKVWAWGDNSDNLLPLSTSNNVVVKPTETTIKLSRQDKIDAEKIIELKPTQIYAGKNHTAIIDDEKSLWMWGTNKYGELGLGHNDVVSTPTSVKLKRNNITVEIASIALGENHTLVVDSIGGLWSFGSNSHNQLGFSKINDQVVTSLNTPYAYENNEDYKSVYAFKNSSFALTSANATHVFGQNDQYQLGFESDNDSVEYTVSSNNFVLSKISGSNDSVFAIDASKRLWVWGTSDTKLGFGNTEDLKTPKYNEQKLVLKNISLNELQPSDIYARAVYVASSTDENVASVYLKGAQGVAADEDYIFISDTQNSRILKLDKETYQVIDICLTPANTTFRQLNLDSTVYQATGLRQFKPTKVVVSLTGRIYTIAEQVYEGIIEFNKQGEYNRYLGQNDVVTNPLKELLRDYITEEQLASFALTLPPSFTSISIDSKGFIYATSYPDESSGTIASQNMVKAINTSGKDCMKRNGYVKTNGDAVYISSYAANAGAVLCPSHLIDVTINKCGNFTTIDEVRGRMFTYDSEGNLLYISGNQPGGQGINSTSGLSDSIAKPVAIDYLYRSYIDANNEEVQEELIIVADKDSKSLLVYETTEFGKLVNQATIAYTAGVDTAEKAIAVRNIWLEVKQRNTNYELAYLGIGKCLLVESDYVDDKDEQLKLYKEAMENFKLAHSGTYYSKAYSRYRDQVLKDNFSWIMTGAVIVALGAVGYIVFKAVKKRQAKIKVEEMK